jgi:hypothetical protein
LRQGFGTWRKRLARFAKSWRWVRFHIQVVAFSLRWLQASSRKRRVGLARWAGPAAFQRRNASACTRPELPERIGARNVSARWTRAGPAQRAGPHPAAGPAGQPRLICDARDHFRR